MRLIDADALLKDSFYEFWQDCSAITPTGEYILSKFRKLIKIAPTVEPEQRKGKWIELDFTEAWEYKCDQCGRLSDFEDNFCPNCGARMER